MSMAVKKKILYYIIYHTLEWNIDPIESKDRYVVDIFFFTAILIVLCLNFGQNKTFEKLWHKFSEFFLPFPLDGFKYISWLSTRI